ncbi:hypothetical protein RUM43_006551 [Polyplax serrata]|uniref:Uncharacterized protein n=1 Tax=Polyplax serrata TaxID=468196 RepID=A0AAN8S931_POLSC
MGGLLRLIKMASAVQKSRFLREEPLRGGRMKEVKNQVRAVPTLKIPKMAKAKLDLSVSEMDHKVKRLGPPSNGDPNQKCFQESVVKSQSSCSETSLLSIGSSEVDELSPVRNRKISDLDVGVTAYKLSHSAAKHKMAVRPRRNHGAPRSRRKTMTSISPLPTTLEVNEEKLTGISPSSMELETSWNQTDSSGFEIQSDRLMKMEDDQDEKEEEGSSQRTESFFGRFLSRRSEKKKKCLQESMSEDGRGREEDKFVKKFTKSSKSPNRRQRVEPMEIPSSPRLRKTEKEAAASPGKVTSMSVSPPKSYCWPTQVTTSRSMSPPKTVWPDSPQEDTRESGSPCVKAPEVSPSFLRDVRNPSFVRELTNSVSLFAKDESGKRKNNGDQEETALKIRRQHSESETPRIPSTFGEEDIAHHRKSNGSETPEESCTVQVVVPSLTEPKIYRTVLTFDEDVRDRSENIAVIDQIKKESSEEDGEEATKVKNVRESWPEVAKPEMLKIEVTGPEPTVGNPPKEELEKEQTDEVEMATEEIKKVEVVEAVKKQDPEVVKRVKPAISQKPKDLKRLGNAGFKRTGPTRPVDPGTPDVKPEKVELNLVERRKSELFLLADTSKLPLRETTMEDSHKVEKEEEGLETNTPEETAEGVVLRRKSQGGHSDEQPELMKVFARRSLKVRETEKMVEDLQRSRDSDKENETVDCDGDEQRNGSEGGKEKKGDGRVSVTPLKPEVASRKNMVQKYGKSLTESNGNKDEMEVKTAVLEENCLNKMRKMTDTTGSHVADKEEEETGNSGGGGGFKRIQQRKAEWERRAQQSAK